MKNKENKTKKQANVNKLPVKIRHPYDLTSKFIHFDFNAQDNRILLRILQRVKAFQTMKLAPQINLFDKTVRLKFNWRDLVLENQNTKDRLLDSLKKLREITLLVPSKMLIDGEELDSTKAIGVIEMPEWDKTRRFVDIRLSLELFKYLTNLGHGYTEYLVDSSFRLSTSYSIKFYYWINHWKKLGGKTLTLKQFRKEFNIDSDKYKNDTVSSFIKRIINPSKKILDEQSDYSFNYSKIKEGRKTVGFSFVFYKTNNHIVINHYDLKRIEEIYRQLFKLGIKLTREDKQRLAGLVKKNTFTFIKSVINTYHFDILEIYNSTKNKKTITDCIQIVLSKNYNKKYYKTNL